MHKQTAIDFDETRWAKVRTTCEQWWAGKLDRPLIGITIPGRDPGRPKPDIPLLGQVTCADLSIPPDQLIDRIDYELSTCHFLGDAFPFFNMHCFGPGVVAAFLGGILDNHTGGVWFYPPADLEISEIHFRFDADNVWFQRVRDIYAAGMKRWQGQVLMGMTDLGGNLDVLSSFRPGEKLLLDLYDEPEEVKRLTWEAHEAWHQFYNALNDVLQPMNPGYSDWSEIYSSKPSYILQCDFSYMISTAMFDEFVKPELIASSERLERTFYHLDGRGQLPHLDSLLTIKELDGVQWVPGDGQPDCGQWPEVYRKIAAAGKKMQVIGGFEVLDQVISQIGTSRGIHLKNHWKGSEADLRAGLARYGIE